jgi:hypothetical protein
VLKLSVAISLLLFVLDLFSGTYLHKLSVSMLSGDQITLSQGRTMFSASLLEMKRAGFSKSSVCVYRERDAGQSKKKCYFVNLPYTIIKSGYCLRVGVILY